MTVKVTVELNRDVGSRRKGMVVTGVLKDYGVIINDGMVDNRLLDVDAYKDLKVISGKTTIKPLRLAMGVSAAELARRIDKSKSAVYSYETGVHNVPDPQREMICKVLNVTSRNIDFDAPKRLYDAKTKMEKLPADERAALDKLIGGAITDVEQANELTHDALSQISKLARYVEGVEYDLALEKEYRRATMNAIYKWNTRTLWQRIKDYFKGVSFDIELTGVSSVDRKYIDKLYREFHKPINEEEQK